MEFKSKLDQKGLNQKHNRLPPVVSITKQGLKMDTVVKLPQTAILMTSKLAAAITHAQERGYIVAVGPTIYSNSEYTCNVFAKWRES